MNYKTNDFNYTLPEALIAQHPLATRTASRLLCVNSTSGQLDHRVFSDIKSLISPNDLLVLNNTKVIPARLFGCKASGGKIECLIERVLSDHEALAHIRSSKSPKPGSQIILESVLSATVLGREGELFKLRFSGEKTLFEQLEECGHMPLPPYIVRSDQHEDRERYQTVFAKHRGAVAAPTASLHFDELLLADIRNQGTAIAYVTLHVGAGTFQPVRVDDIQSHHMHDEWFEVDSEVILAIERCRARGGRVIALGTTVVRALESSALGAQTGETHIFIYPGFEFNYVDALVTNFHLPKSTLLMLVSAFAGYDLIKQAYQVAIQEEYRFFSYGDAMFVVR